VLSKGLIRPATKRLDKHHAVIPGKSSSSFISLQGEMEMTIVSRFNSDTVFLRTSTLIDKSAFMKI
jgi:hypothetical protein